MAISKADRMKAAAEKQVSDYEDKGVFAGLEPLPNHEQVQPKQRSGRAKTTAQKAPETTEAAKVKKSTAKRSEAITEDTKPQKKLFTAYVTAETEARIKKYSKMTGTPIGEVIAAAVTEYISKNPPTEEQRTAYEMKRREEDIDI